MKTTIQTLKMGYLFLALLCLCLAGATRAWSQVGYGEDSLQVVTPYKLLITTGVTTHLEFAHRILSVDRGSPDFVAQPDPAMPCILRVKATRADFPASDLNVVTEDGKLYTFRVSYRPQVPYLTLSFGPEPQQGPVGIPNLNQLVLTAYRQLSMAIGFLEGHEQNRYRMVLKLSGIYARDSDLVFQLELRNRGPIPYKPSALSFLIRDHHRIRNSATQEWTCDPIGIYGLPAILEPGSLARVVCVFQDFTLSSGRKLEILLEEQNGGRNLRLRIGNHCLLRARPWVSAGEGSFGGPG